jgi:hypothetical protein
VRVSDGRREGSGVPFEVAPALVSFAADLGPILLRQGCSSCHFDRTTGTNGFSVANPSDIRVGGNHGPGAIPRRARESLMVLVIRGESTEVPMMPYLGNPMPAGEIQLIEDWIDQGMREN